ncbi:hypothetical protein [Clostridium sp. CM028]|uniref:hypothetical protein n=1 Tax=Clostridium sp. CM028 TaxID=2851575 RepID=UPI0027153F62|nr:hypothetical protein [Clostridium sp. CM028]WLC62245.1 hypothetical protein KTC94_02875 [Clostridium sp. CM028]
MNIIKTAIITIIISFISGLLLDYYRNLGPRILCNVRNGKPIKTDGKEHCTYIITVKNPSNKTIHELTINIQGSQTNLKSAGATITKGLKFDSSIKDNILEVYIPFISKGDEFSVTVYVEKQSNYNNKPIIVIRSPENFKEIDSVEQKGILSFLFNIPKNVKQVILKAVRKNEAIVPNEKEDFTAVMNKVTGAEQTINKENREALSRNKKTSKNKKAIIIIATIILVIIVGGLGRFYFKGISPNVKTPVPKLSTDEKKSTGTPDKKGSTGTPDEKESPVTPDKKESPGTPDEKESPVTPDEKESTGTPDKKEPTVTPDEKEPTVTPDEKEPTVTPDEKEPTVTPDEKEPTVTPDEKQSTVTPSN